MESLSRLLPDATPLHLEAWQMDHEEGLLTLLVTSTQALVYCPICRSPTRRIHSRYVRTVADLPWARWRVVLHLHVRKFFCANGRCTRRMFTERLPQLVAPWARRTQRLAQWLAHIAVALGGAAGARLSRRLSVAVSRNILLRVLRRLALPSLAPPTVLGVDDFAMRKRQTYGTVLIDLERHRPVALLPDRTADTLAQWLWEHSGITIIARDRSKAYAEGVHQGAPEATQVADRFHLLQNLAEALDQVFTAQGTVLDAVNDALRQQPMSLPDGTVAVPAPPPGPPTLAHQRAAQRQARRQTTYEHIWALRRQGWTVSAIAQHVGISPRTVQRDLQTATFPGRKRRSDRGHSLWHHPGRPRKPLSIVCFAITALDTLPRSAFCLENAVRGSPPSDLSTAHGSHPLRHVPCQSWTQPSARSNWDAAGGSSRQMAEAAEVCWKDLPHEAPCPDVSRYPAEHPRIGRRGRCAADLYTCTFT
jgi:transposase